MTTSNLSPVKNYQKVSSKISTGAQPSVHQIQNLQEQGFTTIINLSPTNTKNYLVEEGQVAADLGMNYLHFPIDCSNLQPEQYEAFAHLLKAVASQKTFIHCGMNIKSSGFVHIFRQKELNHSPEQALEQLKELDLHEEKWFQYFSTMGV